ncbi:MAG: hypothetical protein M5R36_22595 [Deltaproteobacteria bacterium]|nr:hypothetical protein [Deltaproteobacteria bacterium]
MIEPFGRAPVPDWWKDHPLWPDRAFMAEWVLSELLAMKMRGLRILNPDEQFAAMAAYFRHPQRFSLADCTVGERGMTINPDGNVRLCPMSRRSVMSVRRISGRSGHRCKRAHAGKKCTVARSTAIC